MAGEESLPSNRISKAQLSVEGGKSRDGSSVIISNSDFPPLVSNSGNKSQNLGFGKNWSSLFSIKSPSEDCSLERQSSVLMESNKGVGLSSKNFEEHSKECEKLVIGFFAGRKASFSMVQEAIKKVWNPKSEVTISIHGDNAFVFNFVNEEDRRVALEHGAFYIAGKLFIVRAWTLLIEQSITEMKTIPIWILIYNVPLHLWNKLGLSSIATFIGNPLMMDEHTKKKTRLTYARVCVEINTDCSFPSLIPLWIDGIHIMDLPVEYQWKPSKCTKCTSFGHNASSCSVAGVKKKARWNSKKNQVHSNSGSKDKELDIALENISQDSHEAVGVEIPVKNLQPNMEDRQQVLQDRVVGERNATDGVQHTAGVVDTANLETLSSDGVVEVSKKTVESGDVIEEPFIKSKTYARRNKNSGKKKGNSHEQIPICYLNPYNVLGSDHETTISEIPKSTENNSIVVDDCDIAHIFEEKLPENLEDDPEVNTCEDEESEYETDNDVLDVAKVKSVEQVSRWKPMSKEQNMDKLMKFSSLICLPSGGKETEVKKLFGGIVDSFHSSKQIKDLGPSTEDLGRGKRTPKPKKKL